MEKTLSPIATLYQFLNIRSKLETQSIRVVYLKDVWGLDQKTIGELEGISQPLVSRLYHAAKPLVRVKELYNLEFTCDEIKLLMQLPREILTDAQLIAFVENILRLDVKHIYFETARIADTVRIPALYNLGIQNKHLALFFNKSHGYITMTCKRDNTKYGRAKFWQYELRDTRMNNSMSIERRLIK